MPLIILPGFPTIVYNTGSSGFHIEALNKDTFQGKANTLHDRTAILVQSEIVNKYPVNQETQLYSLVVNLIKRA